MSEFKFNINEDVRVKLTVAGVRVFLERYKDSIQSDWFLDKFSKLPYWETQLWVLMQDFGPKTTLGGPTLFDGNIIFLKDEKVSESLPELLPVAYKQEGISRINNHPLPEFPILFEEMSAIEIRKDLHVGDKYCQYAGMIGFVNLIGTINNDKNGRNGIGVYDVYLYNKDSCEPVRVSIPYRYVKDHVPLMIASKNYHFIGERVHLHKFRGKYGKDREFIIEDFIHGRVKLVGQTDLVEIGEVYDPAKYTDPKMEPNWHY